MQEGTTRSGVERVAASSIGTGKMIKEIREVFQPSGYKWSSKAVRGLDRWALSRRILFIVCMAPVLVSCAHLHTAQTHRDAIESPQVQSSAAHAVPADPGLHEQAPVTSLARQSHGFEKDHQRPVAMPSRAKTQRRRPSLQLLAYETVLLDRVSSTPMRLEALDALSKMPDLDVNDLRPVVLTAIVMDTMHHSKQLPDAARRFLVDYASQPVAQAFETVLADVRADLQSEPTVSPSLAWLTRAVWTCCSSTV